VSHLLSRVRRIGGPGALQGSARSGKAPGGSNITLRSRTPDQHVWNFFLPGDFQPSRTLVRSYQSSTGVLLRQSERV